LHPFPTAPAAAAGWWYRPEFIINELNINAAITQPAHDETVPLTPNAYTVRGYAYTGGRQYNTQ
jgi:nitrate reductase (NAD(P)H)